MRAEPGQTLGPFRLDAVIGRGGVGVVYRAVDTRTGRVVALKVLEQDATPRSRTAEGLLREARAASRVQHPAVGAVQEAAEWDGQGCIVMPLYEGETLAARIARGALPIDDVESVLRRLASGLAATHAAGILHRDLKPANVMLTNDGQVKILDFGLARAIAPDRDGASLAATASSAGAGTIAYMSPEQVRGDTLDARTDVWALGAIAYEMLAGESPFAASTLPGTVSRILTEAPPPLRASRPDVPPWLLALVGRMLDKHPRRRPRDGAAVLAALEARAMPRRTIPWIASTAAAAAVAALLWVDWQPAVPSPATLPAPSPPPPRGKIVALPCRVRGDASARFLTDAIPAMLTTAMAQIPGLSPQVPPSSSDWDPEQADLASVAAAYGAGSCVQCDVAAAGAEVVLDLAIRELPGGAERWRGRFDGTEAGYAELVRQAAEALRRTIRPDSDPVVAPPRSSASPEADLQLRRGRHLALEYMNHREAADLDSASAAYREALALDPGAAAAADGLAWTYYYPIESGADPGPLLPQANAWADRALAIDARCAEAWALRALAVYAFGPPDQSRMALQFGLKAASIQSSPCLGFGQPPAGVLGPQLRLVSHELAITGLDEAMRLAPMSMHWPLMKAGSLGQIGRPAEGLRAIEQGLAADGRPYLVLARSGMMLLLGRLDDAEENVERLRALAAQGKIPSDFVLDLEAPLAFARGDHERAAAAMGRIRELLDGPPERLRWSRPDAHYLAHLGRYEEAIEILVKCDAKGSVWNYEMLTLNPDFAPILDDPRLAGVLEHSRARYYRWLGMLVSARERGELPAYLNEPLDRILRRQCLPEPTEPS